LGRKGILGFTHRRSALDARRPVFHGGRALHAIAL
jgi:hypothetical protein